MAEQFVCPSEETMEYEERIAQLEHVTADLCQTVDRLASEKADLLVALKESAKITTLIYTSGAYSKAWLVSTVQLVNRQARAAIAKTEEMT